MALTDEQVLEGRDDLEMLKRPRLWPSLLRGGHRCVFLRRGRDHTGPCVRLTTATVRYVVLDHDWTDGGKVTKREYDSAEAILADGWVVD